MTSTLRLLFGASLLALTLPLACDEHFVLEGAGGAGGVAGGLGGAAGSSASGGAPVVIDEPLPVDESALMLWLRADRGVELNDGLVYRWRDQSANAAHANQVLSAARPTLVADAFPGGPGLMFDGSTDFLALPEGTPEFSAGMTIFVVGTPSTNTACGSFIEFSNGNELNDISIGYYEQKFLFEIDAKFIQPKDPYTLETPALLTAITTSNSSLLRLDGADAALGEFGSPTNDTRSLNYIGRTSYEQCEFFKGKIAEILLFSRTLDADEVDAIEAVLKKRWL